MSVPKWTLCDALQWIRANQLSAMEAGWYLALAGGVLNHGYSDNDLDLVAMPRSDDSDVSKLLGLLGVCASWPVPAGRGYGIDGPGGKAIEITVVTPYAADAGRTGDAIQRTG